MSPYIYRADEDIDRLPVAPYVHREEEHVIELPIDKSKCGTFPGYKQHRSRGHDACDKCKAAAAEREAQRRKQRKEADRWHVSGL